MIKNKYTIILKSIQCLAVVLLVIFLGLNTRSTPTVLTSAHTDSTGTLDSAKEEKNSELTSSESEIILDPVTYSEIESSVEKLSYDTAFIAPPETETDSQDLSDSEPESESSSNIFSHYLPEDSMVSEFSDNDSNTPAIRISKINGFVPHYLEKDITEYAIVKPGWEAFEQELTRQLESYEGSWSLYLKDLNSDKTISINDHAMESASLIKLYIMGAVYQQIENKKLDKTEKIQNLLNDMIMVSDNESSNELVRALSSSGDHPEGMALVNSFIRENGFANTKQVNGLADPSLWVSSGEVNTTSASDCGKLLEAIYQGNFISHLASRDMETLMLNQKITYKIPRGLPDGTHCANKTGEVDNTENDAAIVYSPGGDYILCIMSTDLENTDIAVSHINTISKQIYNYLN